MTTLFETILRSKRPFIYLHTHTVTDKILQNAIDASGSIEIDISVSSQGELFIGHPPSFYEYKEIAMPANLPIDQVMRRLGKTNLYVVLDCKDINAIEWVKRTIGDIGKNRIIFHSWSDSLLFKPYDAGIEIEPHWIHEDLPHSVIENLYDNTQVPMILSARGLTARYVNDNYNEVLLRILQATSRNHAAIHFNLPGGRAPSLKIMNTLLEHRIMTLLNVDVVPPSERPKVFIGMTDHIDQQRMIR